MAISCPHCGASPNKKDVLPTYAIHNAESYHQPLMVVTLCCGKPVRVYPQTILNLAVYDGNNTVDDWGTPIKKK